MPRYGSLPYWTESVMATYLDGRRKLVDLGAFPGDASAVIDGGVHVHAIPAGAPVEAPVGAR